MAKKTKKQQQAEASLKRITNAVIKEAAKHNVKPKTYLTWVEKYCEVLNRF